MALGAETRQNRRVASEDRDRLVRAAAFAWRGQLVTRRGDVLPITILREGFKWEGHRVPVMGPQGIFKPGWCPRSC